MKRVTMTLALACVVFICGVGPAEAAEIDLGNLDWSVQYMIDTSQSDFGAPQSPEPRNNRGLALSPDGNYIYAGYNDEYVRRIDLSVADYIDASVAQVTGVRGKDIAVDDVGRVYLAEGSSDDIQVYNADLSTLLTTIAATKCEGVVTAREGGTLVLYGTDRSEDTLTRWELTESGGTITAAVKAGFDVGAPGYAAPGVLNITDGGTPADDLHGVAIDGSGRIWMADEDGNKVWRVDADGNNQTYVALTTPKDLDVDGTRVLVTQAEERLITAVNGDMTLGAAITAPWAALSLDPDGQSSYGAFGGIAVVPGVGFYVTNESGQTADERSIYGRTDGNSGWDGATFYTDLSFDDNDPLLYVTEAPPPIPEPAGLGLIGLALLAVRKRRS